MVTYDQDQNIQFGITGAGQTVWAALFKAPDGSSPKVFVKALKTAIPTVAATAQNILVNEAASGVDSIPVGDNYDVYVLSEITHPPASFSAGDAIPAVLNGGPVLPQDFSLKADKVNPPDIFWPPTFGCIADPDECYQDSAGSIPSLYSDVDAVKADVGNLAVKKEAGVVNPLFTLVQTVTAQKPSLNREAGTGGDFSVLEFAQIASFDYQNLDVVPTAGATVANSSYIESIYAMTFNGTGSSSGLVFSLPDGLVNKIGTANFRMQPFLTNIPAGKHVVRVVRSASAANGPSELYVDGILIESLAVYFPTVTMETTLGALQQSLFYSPNGMKYHGGMVMHDGKLNAAEATAMTTHYGNKLGLSL